MKGITVEPLVEKFTLVVNIHFMDEGTDLLTNIESQFVNCDVGIALKNHFLLHHIEVIDN
jgi:hypothetical protein